MAKKAHEITLTIPRPPRVADKAQEDFNRKVIIALTEALAEIQRLQKEKADA